jgi:hypothetical protein
MFTYCVESIGKVVRINHFAMSNGYRSQSSDELGLVQNPTPRELEYKCSQYRNC